MDGRLWIAVSVTATFFLETHFQILIVSDLLYINFRSFKIFPFCIQRVYCSIFQMRMGWIICLPTRSGLLLVTCYLSFSPTAWKIVGSRVRSQAKASGNRLRHALRTNPLYLHSPLQWDSFSLSFPRPLLPSVKSLCVLSHPFCNSRTVFLQGFKVQSAVSNFVRQLQIGTRSCMQKKLILSFNDC